MPRVTFTVGLIAVSALVVGSCDDDDNEVDDVDITIVENGDVPFDPDVPEGVDTDVNGAENQGADGDEFPATALAAED